MLKNRADVGTGGGGILRGMIATGPQIPIPARSRALSALAGIVTAGVLLAGCSGSARTSGGGGYSALPTLSDTANDPTVAAPESSSPSNIVNNYDTALCSDWKVTDPTNRKIVTTYFIVRANADDLTDYEEALETAITVACTGFPEVTVKRVASLSIPELRKQIASVGGN